MTNKRKRINPPKRERGRPQKLGTDAIEQICEYAKSNLSLREMAGMLGTSRTAITTLLSEYPEIKTKIQALRARPQAMAKLLLTKELEAGSVEIARWLLERSTKLKSEAERMRLIRTQRRALEATLNGNPDAPAALDLGEHWRRVNDYFTNRNSDPEAENNNPADSVDLTTSPKNI